MKDISRLPLRCSGQPETGSRDTSSAACAGSPPRNHDPRLPARRATPYYLSGKPIVSVVFRGSYLEKILRELGCSFIVTFELGESQEDAYARLGEFFQAALNGFPPAAWPPRDDVFFNQHFLAENLTAQQCALFEAAVANRATALKRGQPTDIPCVERK
jgi:hypothetical protein